MTREGRDFEELLSFLFFCFFWGAGVFVSFGEYTSGDRKKEMHMHVGGKEDTIELLDI